MAAPTGRLRQQHHNAADDGQVQDEDIEGIPAAPAEETEDGVSGLTWGRRVFFSA